MTKQITMANTLRQPTVSGLKRKISELEAELEEKEKVIRELETHRYGMAHGRSRVGKIKDTRKRNEKKRAKEKERKAREREGMTAN